MSLGHLPSGLSLWHPAAFLATWGGSGLLPRAPGTWGSLFALPFAWIIATEWGSEALFIAAALTFLAGLWASAQYLKYSTSKDPGAIVIDETAGQFLALALVPVELWCYAAGFILFRLADIFKPWPASWADRSLRGALGVMTDDIFAAVYVLVVLYSAHLVLAG
jgi:phosphatidylglycerophosphatase A